MTEPADERARAEDNGADAPAPPTDDDYEQLRREYTFTTAQVEEVKEEMRREEEDRARRLFKGRKPFPIPDTDTDA